MNIYKVTAHIGNKVISKNFKSYDESEAIERFKNKVETKPENMIFVEWLKKI